MNRTLVIGDIHGSNRALLQVFEKANIQPTDTIIQLGDVADGWSETSQCVDTLLELQKTNKCIFLRGNHDVGLYDWINYGTVEYMWKSQGGQESMLSYMSTDKHLTDEHKDFWNNQVDWYIDEQNRCFIHAGWSYLFHNKFEIAASEAYGWGSIAKQCHWDRTVFKSAAAAFYNKGKHNDFEFIEDVEKRGGKFKTLEQFKEVYIGHTAHTQGKPLWLGNLCNMDTGCGWDGFLTIMDVDTKEYWISDYSKDLYPKEKGR